MASTPLVTFVIATHNRCAALQRTLAAFDDCGLSRAEREVIVVDNNSDDGTRRLLETRRDVRPIFLDENLGSCAKAIGAREARAPVWLFLDDDSYPRAGCVHRMLGAFHRHPRLAAAGFVVRLPNGQQECSALPHVFVGCGVGLRASAALEVGGLDETFFMQAEEYDLTIRLLEAGYQVERFADLQVEHLKTPLARTPAHRVFYDIRNNLRIIGRYLPDRYATVYQADWEQRYQAFAERDGHLDAFARGRAAGLELAADERPRYQSWRIGDGTFEQLFAWKYIQHRMQQITDAGFRRIGLLDVSKNLYPFVRAARRAELDIVAVFDGDIANHLPNYRDLPVRPLDEAPAAGVDAFIVANCSYVHSVRRARWLRPRTRQPVFNWFTPPRLTTLAEPAQIAPDQARS